MILAVVLTIHVCQYLLILGFPQRYAGILSYQNAGFRKATEKVEIGIGREKRMHRTGEGRESLVVRALDRIGRIGVRAEDEIRSLASDELGLPTA